MRWDSSPGSSEPGAVTSAPWFWVSVEARRDGGARGRSREAGLSPTGRRGRDTWPGQFGSAQCPRHCPRAQRGGPCGGPGRRREAPGLPRVGPGRRRRVPGSLPLRSHVPRPPRPRGILNVRGRSRRPDYCPRPREYSGDQSGRSFLLLDKKTIFQSRFLPFPCPLPSLVSLWA